MRIATTMAPWVCLVAATLAGATEVDVQGSWQVNIDCGFTATATTFLAIAEDSASGALNAEMPSDCGSVDFPDAIHRASSCATSPATIQGLVHDATFTLPTAGYYTSDTLIVPPFSYLSCTAVARIVSSHQLVGKIAQAGDRAAQIDGTWTNGPLAFDDGTGAACFTLAAAPSCTFSMRRNDVPVGTNVTVSPRAGTTVTFATVTQPGTAMVMPLTEANAAVPADFQVLGSGKVPIFYDVHTDAVFMGTVTTCFTYPDANGDGVVDGTDPPLDETDLKVLHEENGVFVDRTISLDTVHHVICGATEHLSQLTVAARPIRHDLPIDRGRITLRRGRSGSTTMQFQTTWRWDLPQGAAADPRHVSAVVDLFADSATASFPLPARGWRGQRHGRILHFGNPAAPNATSAVATATLDEPHRTVALVIRAVDVPLDKPLRALGLRITVGSSRFCIVYAPINLRQRGPNVVVARGYQAPPADCADKAIRAALVR